MSRLNFNARAENRTRKELPPADFESITALGKVRGHRASSTATHRHAPANHAAKYPAGAPSGAA